MKKQQYNVFLTAEGKELLSQGGSPLKLELDLQRAPQTHFKSWKTAKIKFKK